MTQRTSAGLLAVPLFVALGLDAAISPLPFVTYEPGPTVNVLGENDGKPIIQVAGTPDLPRRRAAADDDRLRHPARRRSTSSS